MVKKLLLFLTVFAAMVVHADVTNDQLWFSYNGQLGGYSVRARSGVVLSGVLNIPDTYNDIKVVEITDDAFNPQSNYNNSRPQTSGITKVVLPASIEKIGNYAFYYLKNLTEVDMSACVNAEDFGGKSIFKDCSSLATVIFPPNASSKLKTIGPGMFYRTALTSIALPYSVKTIGMGAFEGCDKLKQVNQYYAAGASYPNNNYLLVTSIGKQAFMGCDLSSVVINIRGDVSTDRYTPWLTIQNGAFQQNNNLANVNINGPSNVVIGDMAFYSTKLTSFSGGRYTIGACAFPKEVKFNDGYYSANQTGSNYYDHTDDGAGHDKYSHVDANGIQYFLNTISMDFMKDANERNDVEVYRIGDPTKTYFPYPAKRLGQITSGASTSKDNLVVENNTSMIDAGAFRNAQYKTLTLNDDGELKYIGSDMCTGMTKLRELTIPSSVRVFHPSYGDGVVTWGPTTNSLEEDASGSGSASIEYGICHDTPAMAYLDMSKLEKSTFTGHFPFLDGERYYDEFTVSASLFNGTSTYRSNKYYYNNNLFDGMYEPTLVYLPRNTEDMWVGEDYEVYGRNFIFTNDGETPYCHLYEAYDYYQPTKNGTWSPTGGSTEYRAGRDYYAIPHDFIAKTAKYNRNFTKGLMYTVCIPFAVDAGKYGTFYEPSSYDGTTLKVKPINAKTTQPRTPYVFVPNDDYTALLANNVLVKAIPDGSVEAKVATGTEAYVEDESAFPDQDGDVLAKLCGIYETHQFGVANQNASPGAANPTKYGTLLTNGQIIYLAQNQGALLEYPFHAAIWASNKQFTKIELEGDGRPEIAGVYRSFFDVENIKNDYRNSVRLVNPEVQPMMADQFSPGTTMLINRVDYKGDSHVIANIAITGKTASALNYRLTMTNGDATSTGTFSIGDDNVVNFNDLTVEDTFSASTATNEHITRYDYQLSMIDAKGNDIKTNVVEVPIYKTRYLATGAGFTYNQVYADNDHSMPLRKAIPAEMRMYSDASITGYELLRNGTTVGSSAEKAEGSNTYVVSGYGLNEGNIEWMTGLGSKEVTDKDGWLMVDMQDCIDPEQAGSSVNYLPRINAKTTDFDGTTVINNTYGGVESSIVACDVEIEVSNPEKTIELSDDIGTWDFGGKYQGYAATVKLKAVLPNDYQVYMYRLWRVMPDGTETLLNNYSSDYANRNYAGYKWGSDYTALQKRDLEIEIRDVFVYKTISQLGGSCPTKYIARLYAQTPKPAARAPRGNRISITGYDAAEKVGGVDFSGTEIPTAIGVVKSDSGVQKVTYYNTAGVSSSTPFDGLNVVVTVKADGTRQVTKMVK